ncbi:MAG: tyrosine recombinase [Chloroflexi bacterium]|nr:tyrosine recombinase [Chloroflexota bacterium]MBK6709763.1 tyrosine recombinase [Chloroflexota bacterium]MBK7179899.1 tyrosine recombinase [Chloroflexota bacterium]MBK7918629.1 tyrosine recombinase [Chloroflexota bacterium]MBK8932729.1 tyrosine recombinase [Chloroflexota bacterium]
MEEQLQDFLDYLQQEYKYSNNTTAAYKNDLSQFMTFLENGRFHVEQWAEVTAPTVNAYVAFMKDQAYASSSVARKVAAVKSFFNYLFARNLITENPTTNIDSPKVKKRLPKTLSFEDIEKLLLAPRQKKSPKHLRDTALLTMLYSTGMRVTEVVSLAVDDVNLDDNVLFCQGKDESSRELPLDKETSIAIDEYLANGRQYLVKNKDESALFLNHRGQQLTRQGLWLIIKAYAKKAKLSGEVTPHTLRHSFAAHKLEGGSDLQEVQRLLGHANISTTQIYTQISAEDEIGEHPSTETA